MRHLWLVLALALTSASLFSAALVQRRVFRAAGVPLPVGFVLRVTLASNSLSVGLPFAGSAAGTAFSYRQYRKMGAPAGAASWALVTSGAISLAVLGSILLVGETISAQEDSPIFVLTLAVLAVLLWASRSRLMSSSLVRRLLESLVDRERRAGPHHGTPGGRCPDATSKAQDGPVAVRIDRRCARTCVAFSTVNWIGDLVALAVCIAAAGSAIPWSNLCAVYAVALGAASFSFLPAGIGIVETAIAVALVRSGISTANAAQAAVLYRAVSCWLPIAAGWIGYTSFRRGPLHQFETDTASSSR